LALAAATAWLEPQAYRPIVGNASPSNGSAGASPSIGFGSAGASPSSEKVGEQLAPGALGTRGSTPLRTATPSGSGYAWLQMTLALVLVAVGLRYGLPRLIGWAGKAGVGSRLDGEIRLLESRAVPGGSLLMVKARDRLLLIGATPQGMQLLADLTAPQADSPQFAGQAGEFERILHRAVSAEAKANARGRAAASADLQQETASELQAHIEQARARLSRMATGGSKW